MKRLLAFLTLFFALAGVADAQIRFRKEQQHAETLYSSSASPTITSLWTFSGGITVATGTAFFDDSIFVLRDDLDNSKRAQFQVSGVTTGTTRTFTFPDVTGSIPTGTGTANQVAYWSATSILTATSGFTFTGSTASIGVVSSATNALTVPDLGVRPGYAGTDATITLDPPLSANSWFLRSHNTGGRFAIIATTGPLENLTVLQTGEVGIGVAAPTSGVSLEVADSIKMPYDATFLGKMAASTEWTVFQTSITGVGDGLTINPSNGNTVFNTTSGNVGIGLVAPIGKLDVSTATRSGTQAVAPSVYFTAGMGTGQTGYAAGNVELRHSNATQGIGFGYNTIYQAGSDTNAALNLLSKGTSPITLNAYAYSTGNVGIGTAANINQSLTFANTGTIGFVNAAVNTSYQAITMNASNEIIYGNTTTTQRIRTLGGTPGTLGNGDVWWEVSGTTPNRLVCQKMYDGSATRDISCIVY